MHRENSEFSQCRAEWPAEVRRNGLYLHRIEKLGLSNFQYPQNGKAAKEPFKTSDAMLRSSLVGASEGGFQDWYAEPHSNDNGDAYVFTTKLCAMRIIVRCRTVDKRWNRWFVRPRTHAGIAR